MKTIAIIAILIIITCFGIVLASGGAITELICPVCKHEIKPGSYTIGLYGDGEIHQTHFKHGFDEAMERRYASLRDIRK